MDYFESGFAVRKPSWHAKEDLLQVAPDLTNWREAAGLTWEPVKIPLYLPAPVVAFDDQGAPVFGQARESGTYAIVRNDRLDLLDSTDTSARDSAVLARGVSADFTPVEHERDMTPLLDAIGQACEAMGVGWEFTTAGSVRDGKQVYACIMLDRPISLPGDDSLTLPFGVILNGHDGTMAARGGLTQVRVVCANTYAMAESDLDGHKIDFTIRHSGDTETRLAEARQTIAGWLDAIESYKAMATHLCSLKADADVVTEWVAEFLPIDEGRMTDRQISNRKGERAMFERIHADSPTTDGIRGNAFGLWQTTIEFMDHVRKWNSADAYMRRTMLDPADSKVLARTRITELCEAVA